jgi:hypothetical protein
VWLQHFLFSNRHEGWAPVTELTRLGPELLRLVDGPQPRLRIAAHRFDNRPLDGRLPLRLAEPVGSPLRVQGEQAGGQQRQTQCAEHRRRHRVALDPLPESGDRSGAAGEDGEAVDVAAQVVGQLLRRLLALVGVLAEAFEADSLQVARHLRVDRPRRGRLLLHDHRQQLVAAVGPERRPQRQQFLMNLDEQVR